MRTENFNQTLYIYEAFKLRWVRITNPNLVLLVRATTLLVLGALFSITDIASATEISSPLTGQWQVAETADEKNERMQTINEATGHLASFQQVKARDRLSERTSPPQSLLIEIKGEKVSIASGNGRLDIELEGPPIEVSGRAGKAQISAKMQDSLLIVLARSSGGERTTVYRASGDRLIVEVTMTGARLAKSLKYVSSYVRTQ
jgi:hypothetical protein